MKLPNKSFTLDPVPTKVIRPIPSHLLKLSIATKTVHTILKEAIVTPLLKTNADLVYKNCRPISKFLIRSKLTEKITSIRMNSYFEYNPLSEPLQSAYRGMHSIVTALIKVFDHLLTNLNQRQVILLLFLDLTLTFIKVDHSQTILLKRLQLSFGLSQG